MEKLSQWLGTFLFTPPAECAQQRKAARRLAPLELNLVCIGRKGLGKTSAIETLFGVSANTTETVTHSTQVVHVDDSEAEINLRVTDGPGFVDDNDVQDQVRRLVTSIKGEMRQYAFAQKTLSHHHPDGVLRDPRTHLILFFVPPGELPEIDRKSIDTLLPCANVAVIAAKADSMVPEELKRYKQEISQQLDDSSARRRRRREGFGVTTDEPYIPFGGIMMGAPRSSPVSSPVFAVIGKERRYTDWRGAGMAAPTDSDSAYSSLRLVQSFYYPWSVPQFSMLTRLMLELCMVVPHLREQILSHTGTDALITQTDLRFTGAMHVMPSRATSSMTGLMVHADHFERGELRNSVFTAKATAIGTVVGSVLGMCIKQQIAWRLQEAARASTDDAGSSPAERLAARADAAKVARGQVPGAPVLAGLLFGATLGASYHSIFGKLD